LVAGRRWGLRKTDFFLLLPAAAILAARFVMGHHYIGGFDCYVYWTGVREFLKGVNPYTMKEFVTPPSGIIPLLPMRLVSFNITYWSMMTLTAAAVVTGLFVTFRRLTSLRPPEALALAFVVAAVPMPTYTTIGFGSLNGVIFMTFAFALAAMLDGNDRNAGIWLGVGLALKPVLIPFWLLFVIQRRWGAALWSFVPVAAGSAVALVINPKAIHFIDDGLPNIVNGLQDRFTKFNITVVAFVRAAGYPKALGSAGRLGAAVLTVAVAYVLWRRYRERAGDAALEWLDVGSILFAGTLLTSSFAWRYYVIFLIPLFVRAARRASRVFHPVLWFGVFLATVPDGLGFRDASEIPRKFATGRYTFGVMLVIVGVGLALLQRRAGSDLGEGDAALVEPRLGLGG
jgi:arabinofuranan 3-O-arabinosyltransferase